MPPKKNKPVAQAKRGRPKNEDDEINPTSTSLSTPVTKKTIVEDDHPTSFVSFTGQFCWEDAELQRYGGFRQTRYGRKEIRHGF